MSEYRKIKEYPAIRLTLEDLIRLEDLMLEGFADNERALKVTLNIGDRVLTGQSIKDIVATHPSIQPDSIRLSASDWRNSDIIRGISIDMFPLWVHCHINAKDEVWFNGKFIQIGEFLKRKRPWYGAIRPYMHWLFGGFSGPLCLGVGFFLFKRHYIWAVIVFINLILLVRFAIAFGKGKVLPVATFKLTPPQPMRLLDCLAILFAGLSAMAAIAGLILQVLRKSP